MPDGAQVGPTASEKIANAETMFGTGSKEHIAAQGRFGKDASKEERAAARAFTNGALDLNMTDLVAALERAYGDSYVAGMLTAAQQTGANMVAGLGQTLPADAAGWTSFWDSWTPGNIPAGDLLNNGGLARLLDQTGETVKGIEGSTLDRLGNLLADGVVNGDSIDTIAGTLGGFIDNPDRAFTIADTETARAVSNASMDGYEAAGVEQVEWLTSPGACEICVDYGASGPFVLNDAPGQPAHPRCRCSYSPIDPGTGVSTGEDIEGDVGDAGDIATRMVDAATSAEPHLTDLVSGFADEFGGTMEGMDYRLKSVDSLTRKIESGVAEGKGTASQLAADMFDINRYTTVYSETSYAESIQSTLDALREQGHTLNVKNYWTKDEFAYQGVNVQITTPAAQKFELQFHTDTSLAVKEGDLHTVYEAKRIETDEAKRAEYDRQMFDMAAKIPVPPGITSVR